MAPCLWEKRTKGRKPNYHAKDNWGHDLKVFWQETLINVLEQLSFINHIVCVKIHTMGYHWTSSLYLSQQLCFCLRHPTKTVTCYQKHWQNQLKHLFVQQYAPYLHSPFSIKIYLYRYHHWDRWNVLDALIKPDGETFGHVSHRLDFECLVHLSWPQNIDSPTSLSHC